MICKSCGIDTEKQGGQGCPTNLLVRFADGEMMASLPVLARELYDSSYCAGCGAYHETRHHPGCPLEKCPRCLGELQTCPCEKAG